METSQRKISPFCREKIIAPPLILWSTLQDERYIAFSNADVLGGLALRNSFLRISELVPTGAPTKTNASCKEIGAMFLVFASCWNSSTMPANSNMAALTDGWRIL